MRKKILACLNINSSSNKVLRNKDSITTLKLDKTVALMYRILKNEQYPFIIYVYRKSKDV